LAAVLPHVVATRYVTPLREGGSLPGLMEADDLGTYVVKFHGAGQGRKALIAEVISGHLARALGFAVPDLVTVDVDPVLAAGEPDQEVQDLLRASGGLNLGIDYLPGALDFDPAAFPVEPVLAGQVLWFDAFVGNVDRSWRNPNMLYWHGTLYLIDHGATLTFHHNWSGAASASGRSYDAGDHSLIAFAPEVEAADAHLAPQVTTDLLQETVAQIPDRWLEDEPGFTDAAELRAAYVEQLTSRLQKRDSWLSGLRSGAARDRDPEPARRGSGRPGWLSDALGVRPEKGAPR
jgi:hypothetical protein